MRLVNYPGQVGSSTTRQEAKLEMRKPCRSGPYPWPIGHSERPAIVEEKVRICDWEADTIVGKGHSGAIVSLVDRAAKYTFVGRVDEKTKDAVGPITIRLLGSGKVPIHTITADNGREFADDSRVVKNLDVNSFFARPCRSWLSTEYAGSMCRLVPRRRITS